MGPQVTIVFLLKKYLYLGTKLCNVFPNIAIVLKFYSIIGLPSKETYEHHSIFIELSISRIINMLVCWRRMSLLDCYQEQSPAPISFMSRFVYRWGDRMEANSKRYHSNSKTRPSMHR